MKKPSIKEIAQLSGVSVATVSRVINDNGRFSEETRQRVLKVIEETGYQMNYNAKGLRMNRSFSVGILVPDISNFFFSDVVQKIEKILFNQGYSTIICNTGRDEKKEIAYLQMLESKMVDGLIIISGVEKFDFSKTNINRSIPYVCIDREPVDLDDTIFISSNHYQGGFEATEELFRTGVQCPMVVYSKESTSSKERRRGFADSLKKHGQFLELNKNAISFDRKKESLSDSLEKIFKQTPEIDGVFAINDTIAIELLEIFPQFGKSIPSDIKLIGFDDIPIGRYCSPTLSTVKQNTEEISNITVSCLLKSVENSGEEILNRHLIPVELVLRESTQNFVI